VFTADQRVLWAGLTRHLSVAHGVKAVVTADMLGRKLQMKDLGIAGPAVSAGKGVSVLKYLNKSVEARIAPPAHLTNWILETLEVGHSFGFLKKQEGYGDTSPLSRLYELSHDSLDDIFRLFSLEFEKWMAKRIYIFWSLIFVLFFVLPYFTIEVLDKGILQVLIMLMILVVVGAFYLGLVLVFILIAPDLSRPRELTGRPVGHLTAQRTPTGSRRAIRGWLREIK
jgi:hypothetical protein